MTTSLGGQPCKSCIHPRRNEIDIDLVKGLTAAEVGRRYGINAESVRRHKAQHIHRATVAAAEAERKAGEEKHGANLLGLAQGLANKAINLLQAAERSGDLRGALSGIGQAINALTLVSKLTGAAPPDVTLNVAVVNTAERDMRIAAALLKALSPFPAALQAARVALAEISGEQSAIEHEGG